MPNMPNETVLAPHTGGYPWAGCIITGLVILFLVFDGATKIIPIAPVMEASEKLGLSRQSLPAIGALLLVCTAVFAFPRTAVVGAILLTGYLGGAAAIHVRAASGWFPIAFSVGFGAAAWIGLFLREPKLLAILLGTR